MVKLYKNLVNSAALTLQEIFLKNKQADKALEKLFKQHPQWGSRDRRFVAEAVYDIVRNYRLYSELAESKNNFWFMMAVWLLLKGEEIPDWQEFKHVNANFILSKHEELKQRLPVFESYPDWLWELALADLGEELWVKEAKAMNISAEVFLRTNTLKTSTEKLKEELLKDKIETELVPGSPSALKLVKRQNIFQNRLFKLGWFEVQDAGSQGISEFMHIKTNDLLIDACAGAGGKSLHLAALLKNRGKIISLDLEAWKLEELKKRAKRAGAFNIETRVIEAGTTIKSLAQKADKVLLDVPCSGLGVLKRNPDAKWKLNQETLDRTRALQAQILDEYSSMVKPNGEMVYSTCSILSSENTQQVKAFLKNHSNFELLEEKNLWPSEGADGFYMARLRRKT